MPDFGAGTEGPLGGSITSVGASFGGVSWEGAACSSRQSSEPRPRASDKASDKAGNPTETADLKELSGRVGGHCSQPPIRSTHFLLF